MPIKRSIKLFLISYASKLWLLFEIWSLTSQDYIISLLLNFNNYIEGGGGGDLAQRRSQLYSERVLTLVNFFFSSFSGNEFQLFEV